MIRQYERRDLIRKAAAGPQPWECVLCRCMGLEADEITHDANCVLADLAVSGVTVAAHRPNGVVFRFHDGWWWWRSPSGAEYHVEKLAATVGRPLGCYGMFDDPGGMIVSRTSLTQIRHWIGLNQGSL